VARCDSADQSHGRIAVTSPESPVDALLAQITGYIAAHRGDAPAPSTAIRKGRFSETVYDRIDEAAVLADSVHVQPFLTPARTPVIGGLWQRVRSSAHQLVVFYVNRHAGAQVAFNREITNGVRELVQELDEDGGPANALEVAALRAEVRALRERLDRLEKAAAAPALSVE
jgi:hypothetical protein